MLEKSRMSAVRAAGRSTHGMCPAPAMISKRAPGIRSAVARTRSGGVEPSWSPTTRRVGAEYLTDEVSMVGVPHRGAGASVAGGWLADEHVPRSREARALAGSERRGEPAPEDGVRDAGDTIALDLADPLVSEPRVTDPVRRVAEHDCAQPRRAVRGVVLSDEPADREPAKETSVAPTWSISAARSDAWSAIVQGRSPRSDRPCPRLS